MVKSIHSKEYTEFAKKLWSARMEVGLTQVEVAKKLKKPQSYISKSEAGEQRLDILEVQRFAKLYGKDICYFLPKKK
ncbi:MAG: helix-turn-helix transcriptional regulator [Patescibacteria group bacterium]|nr:helix-turn-helix transcriptional regulator [Patescibacteria group bacterium]